MSSEEKPGDGGKIKVICSEGYHSHQVVTCGYPCPRCHRQLYQGHGDQGAPPHEHLCRYCAEVLFPFKEQK